MIPPQEFFQALHREGIVRFAGVPDSLLKELCAYITDHASPGEHVITANEGNAIGLAAGWYLGTGAPAMVYMQNSGIGNAINPLASLADPEVYGIPMLLVVGWRGEPGTEDEPQHKKQGRVTTALLEAMEIPYVILDASCSNVEGAIESACALMRGRSGPAAIIVRSGTFSSYEQKEEGPTDFEMTREEAIRKVVDSLIATDVVISTTGKTSRELYEHRVASGTGLENDFLTVGSMGHASSIAMGLAAVRPEREVFCLDGDGAMIMHMGAMAIIGRQGPRNLVHIIFNNGSHDSVGGQPTVGLDIDMVGIAKGCGYRKAISVQKGEEVPRAMAMMRGLGGPTFIEIKVNKGARKDLGRPKGTPSENRRNLMNNLSIHE